MTTGVALAEHFFRHQYGNLVAVLLRRFGMQHLAAVEDAVQSALLVGLDSWTVGELPKNPFAWLYTVAQNRLTDDLRGQTRRASLLAHKSHQAVDSEGCAQATFPSEIQDDLLRVLFLCCDEAIPEESRMVVALKMVCGFSTQEIAHHIFSSEANVYKRLSRARNRLQEMSPLPNELTADQLSSRRCTVHKVLYLLFTEGHLSSDPESAIRRDLCIEAIRLTTMLAEHPICASPETFALLALMHLHSARVCSRLDQAGGLLLLEEQERSLWNQEQIAIGLAWLAKSSQGECFSRYHAEAGVAAEHCLAPTFKETRWERVVSCYRLLIESTPSPLHTLNLAIAMAEWKGPLSGLAVLDGLVPPSWLAGSYQWCAVLADLHARCAHAKLATRYHRLALELAPTQQIRDSLKRRLARTIVSSQEPIGRVPA